MTRNVQIRSQLKDWLLASAIAGGCMMAAAPTAHAQDLTRDPAAQIRQKREKLQEAERKAKALQSDVAQMGEEQGRLNAQLQETARLVQRSEGQMTTIESRRDELEAEQRTVEASLSERQEAIGRLLSAMQRMGRNPPPVIITKREDALEMVRSAMLLSKAFPELKTQYEDLAARLTRLAKVTANIKSERDKLVGETVKLKDAQLKLAQLMESKRQTLTERQEQLEGVRKAAAEISKNVEDLSELIGKLDKAVAERTTLGDYDKAIAKVEVQKTQPTLQGPVAAPVQTPAVPPAQTAQLPKPTEITPSPQPDRKVATLPVPRPAPNAPAVQLEAKGGSATGQATPMQPKMPFLQAKGQLPLPAQGRRVISFGE